MQLAMRLVVGLMMALGALTGAMGQTLVFNPGTVSSIAGNGSSSYSSASYTGAATAAGLNFPRRLTIDANGNIYWMEKGGLLARVLASGKGAIPALPSVSAPTAGWVYTIAGSGGTTVCSAATDKFGDGCPAAQISLNAPYGIAVDAKGNVYLGDAGNFLIRVVYAAGTIPGLPASPVVGNVYVVAGTGTTGVIGDGGPAAQAQIGSSHGLAVDAKGNLYFADSGNQSVRAVYAAGTLPGIASPIAGNLYTLAGGAAAGTCAKATSSCGDGGPAIVSQMNGPDSVGVDANGNIYFSDTSDLRLRAIYAGGSLPGIANPVAGYVYTVAGNGVSGSGPDGVAATASSLTSGMGQPFVDAAGDVYVPDGSSNTVRKIDPSGTITTVAGGAATVCAGATNLAGDGCAANLVTFNGDSSIVTDASGNLYIADYKNNLIRMVTAGSSSLTFTGAIGAVLANQTVLVSNGGAQPLKLSAITFSGPFAQVATGGSDCTAATTLSSGATCQIVVKTTSAQGGTATGSVAVASNALNASAGTNAVALTAVLTQAVTSTKLAIAPVLANVGQPVTLTATISVPAGLSVTPTGSVTFLNGTTQIGATTIAGGQAAFTTSSLAAGTYAVTAMYGGDANFASSVSSALKLVVSATPVPVVTLTPSSSSVAAGQPLTLSATVAAYAGNKVPTGSVTFYDGGVVLGQSSLNAGGGATLMLASVASGANSLTAIYGGDATFAAASSAAVSVTGTAGALLVVSPGKLVTVAGSHTLGAGFSGDGSLGTAAQLHTPLGIAKDSAGNVYFADSANNRIRRIDAVSGNITTIAGTGTACATASLPCGDGGPATAALLNGPQDVRVDAAGNLYILDKGDHAVRKVTASTGNIATVAGILGSAGYTGDGGAAASAKLNGPRGLALDNGDALYIADSGNAVVRRVDGMTCIIATVAGSGSTLGDGGPATAAQLVNPRGLAFDEAGDLFIADMGAYRVRRVDALSNSITTVAGTGTVCMAAPCGDGGLATSAALSGPQGVAVSAAGDLYISEPNDNAVRKVNALGTISTIAGVQSATAGYEADGLAATSGLLSYPNSLLLDAQGNLYLSEANNALLREVQGNTTSLSYGSLALGATSTQTVTLENAGNQAVTLTALSISAGFAQQPSGGVDCAASLTLTAGAACQLSLQFQPLVPGAVNGTVTITSNATNAANGVTTLTLTGTGTGNSGTAAQSITFGALPSVTYGTGPITLQATSSSGLAVEYGSVTGPAVLTGSSLKIVGAGTVSVTAYQFGDATYAAAKPITQTFTVAPATLNVTAANATRAIGAANPAFTYSLSGFVNGDTVSVVSGAPVLSTTATAASPAGTYPINVAQGTLSAANYTFVPVNGMLTVTGQSQTITFAPLPNATYGVAPITLAATSSAGLAVSYALTGPAHVSGAVLTVTGAGTVTVTASQAGNATYAAASPVSQSFTVSPAVLTVTAQNASRPVMAANPAFGYSLAGFVNGDTASVVSGTPAFSTTATQQSPVGTYPITVSQGTLSAANYTFQFAGATLTVLPDYGIALNLSSLTLGRGTTGHVTLTLTPIGNLKDTVNLSCGGLPAGVTCVFTPKALVADGSGTAVTGELDIDTSGALARVRRSEGSSILLASMPWLIGLLCGGLLYWRRRTSLWSRLALGLLAGCLLGGMSGCGAGKPYVTPVQTTITVTGVSSASSSTHTASLSLTLI